MSPNAPSNCSRDATIPDMKPLWHRHRRNLVIKSLVLVYGTGKDYDLLKANKVIGTMGTCWYCTRCRKRWKRK